MIRKFAKYTKRAVKLSVVCIAIKSIHDCQNNKENSILKKFEKTFLNELNLQDNKRPEFSFSSFYENVLGTLNEKSQQIPYTKKTVDIESFEQNLNKMNNEIDHYIVIMDENIKLQSQKIDENYKHRKNFDEKINQILEKAKKERDIIAKKLEDSEKHVSSLSQAIVEINKKIDIDNEILDAYMANTDFLCMSRLEQKMKELGREYSSKMNSLKINSNLDTSEESRKILIIERLEELSKLREKYLKEKLDLIEKEEKDYHKFYFNKMAHLETLIQDFKSLSNDYKNSLLNNISIKNELYSYDQLLDSDVHNVCKSLSEEKMKKLSNELSETLNDQVCVPLINQLKNLIIHEEHLFSIKGMKLRLDEDQEFIRKMSIAHYLRHVLVIKNFLSRIDLNRESGKNDKEMIALNSNELKNFSNSVNDDYCAKLLAKDLNLLSNSEIKSEFTTIKKKIIFETFSSSQSFTNFYFARFMELSSFLWFPMFFKPQINNLSKNDNEIIRTLKYLSHLQYYINKDNYIEAYQSLKNIDNKKTYFNVLENALRERVRATFLVEDLNSHLKSI